MNSTTTVSVSGWPAALMAGAQQSLATAWTVVGLGVLAAIVAGLAVGASGWVIIANVSGLLILLLLGRNRASARVQAEQSAASTRPCSRCCWPPRPGRGRRPGASRPASRPAG